MSVTEWVLLGVQCVTLICIITTAWELRRLSQTIRQQQQELDILAHWQSRDGQTRFEQDRRVTALERRMHNADNVIYTDTRGKTAPVFRRPMDAVRWVGGTDRSDTDDT